MKLIYEDITLTANSGGTGTTGTQTGTFKNVFIDQIVIKPDTSTTSTTPLDNWDLTISEESIDEHARTIYNNTSVPNKTVTTAVIRSGAIDLSGSSISNSHELVGLQGHLELSGANMGTSTTAVVRVFYRDLNQ